MGWIMIKRGTQKAGREELGERMGLDTGWAALNLKGERKDGARAWAVARALTHGAEARRAVQG